MRPIEKTLSSAIRESGFGFLEPGIYSLDQIYDQVKTRYRELCDDHYLCSQNCESKATQPEWMHVVRGCIQYGKTNGLLSSAGRGFWQKNQTVVGPGDRFHER